MYLLIDSGNTRIKWAFINDAALQQPQPGDWLAHGALPHADSALLAQQWQAAIALASAAELPGVLVANVAGESARAAILQQLTLYCGVLNANVQWFAANSHVAGVRNGYANPAQLGCDRFCAVIGAQAILPGKNLLIANCGTATTIDALETGKDGGYGGDFIGGMILPGLALMAQALARNTAQLPQVAASGPLPHGFADNTQDAIISGCITAQAGAIEKAWRDLQQRLQEPVLCVISGGAAFAIAPALSIAHQMLDNLVLLGLQTIVKAQGGIATAAE